MVWPVSGSMGSGMSRSASSSRQLRQDGLAARRAVEREPVADLRHHPQRPLRDVLVGEERLVAVEHDELHRLVQLERQLLEVGRRLVAQLAAAGGGDADEAGADVQLAGRRQAHEALLAERPDDAVARGARQPDAVGERDGRQALGRDRELAQQQRRAREHLHSVASLSHARPAPSAAARSEAPLRVAQHVHEVRDQALARGVGGLRRPVEEPLAALEPQVAGLDLLAQQRRRLAETPRGAAGCSRGSPA